jgi:DNA helicase-2/ATP-dependent DNA helicase PcrA
MYLDYKKHLNDAQYEAVTAKDGPALVIAGAGSGKTRTVVFRMAYLVERGVGPGNILLLTFTRKAAQEMKNRAEELLQKKLTTLSGGTFHSFAFSILRKYSSALGYPNGITIMDSTDSEDAIKTVKQDLDIGKKDRSFPKKKTILGFLSKSRNKELDLEKILEKEAFHLRNYLEDLQKISSAYAAFKKDQGLLDYDDLLFELERLLRENPDILELLQTTHKYILVDEYQDTNRVQARLVKLLAGEAGNVMAVGDDAQSIYGFRGANVRNILDFPEHFPGTRVIKLEQNYRSCQPILTLTNKILENAGEKYAKELRSERKEGEKPDLIRVMNDMSQARVVLAKIAELSKIYPMHEIAVLFRAGYQSYSLEMELQKAGIPFQKYGGMRFSEAAHIKDVLAYMRLVANPTDQLAWTRALSCLPGIGPKTCKKIYTCFLRGEQEPVRKLCAKNSELKKVINTLDELRLKQDKPKEILKEIIELYQPILEEKYADDYPRRQLGLQELAQIVSAYDNLDLFLADMSLEVPEAKQRGQARDELVLSTVHSAKGLEWSAVLLIDLVEDRFPSRHANANPEAMEEERRLMYVACTRARDYLGLFVPENIYNRSQETSIPAMSSPFIQELQESSGETCTEWQETYSGGIQEKKPAPEAKKGKSSGNRTGTLCNHQIFGRGQIIAHLPPNKYKVNFPGYGLKTVIADYLQMEE